MGFGNSTAKDSKHKTAPTPTAKVSPLKDLYRQLDEAIGEHSEFRITNRAVFSRENELADAVEVIKKKIKDALHEQFRGKAKGEYTEYEGRATNVVVTAVHNRVLDVQDLLQARPDLAQHQNLIEVHFKELDKLTQNDPELAELVQRLTREVPGTPRISFEKAAPPADAEAK
jgi:hypothetical protein